MPIIVFLLVILLNNSFVIDILSDLLSKLSKKAFIINNVSLFIRALVSAILLYVIQYLDIIYK